ncbi:uncharacterized protein LOC121690362 [Alosa sapidissima]|uniref:uncharacterized protein LOC121690362 n=1 Tax=Alosa sapidissima TaxID=34773 RepID=UPI001C08EC41|nr:uncharacterized protein LOC121690362 [Alosa sapidissima]
MARGMSGQGYFDYATPAGRGRGRGLYMNTGEEVKKLCFTDTLVGGMATHTVGFTSFAQTPPPLISDSGRDTQVKVGHVFTFPVGPKSSTPIVSTNSNDPTAELCDLITVLGNQIGDSIASWLFATPQSVSPSSNAVSLVLGDRHDHTSSTLDLTKVNVIVKPDVREPAVFRGEESDKCTVQEWIELMEVYLRKKNCPALDRAEEILSHLMGRAKKIVKVGLKSVSTPDETVQPEMIYDALRQYFSKSPVSCLPLADFYATQPSVGESPVDYWVRLNTAAEQADRHLKKQGRKLENMSAEISMMFIRNCNDPDLSSVFKSKPMSRWTSTEVQEAIDEHQREHLSKKKSANVGKVKTLQVATAATYSMAEVKEEVSQMHQVHSALPGLVSVQVRKGVHSNVSFVCWRGCWKRPIRLTHLVFPSQGPGFVSHPAVSVATKHTPQDPIV